MALTPTEQDAAERLSEYNDGRYDASTNQLGLAGEGYKINIPAAFNDMGTVTEAVSRLAGEANAAAAVVAPAVPIVTAARDQAVAAALSAAGIVQHVQPSEIAGIDPVLDFPFSGPAAVPSGVIQGSSGKWVMGQGGVLVNVAAGTAPINYDATTGALRGLLTETARTNLILGSDAPSTQAVSAAAQAYTLSFYGTGSVTLSGAHSATVAGAGAFPAQKTLTFTPSAGTLTLTVSGTVQYAQLEAGSVASSYIRTVGSTVTRAGDVNAVALSSVSGWNASEGSLFISFDALSGSQTGNVVSLHDGTASNYMRLLVSAGALSFDAAASGVAQAALSGGAVAANTVKRVAISWEAGVFSISVNGAAAVSTTTGTVPAGLTTLGIGGFAGFAGHNGHIGRLVLWSRYTQPATLALISA